MFKHNTAAESDNKHHAGYYYKHEAEAPNIKLTKTKLNHTCLPF